MYMLKYIHIIFLTIFIFFQVPSFANEEKFLSLKKNKVNVRYGPGFDFPIKYIYKKINLPIKQSRASYKSESKKKKAISSHNTINVLDALNNINNKSENEDDAHNSNTENNDSTSDSLFSASCSNVVNITDCTNPSENMENMENSVERLYFENKTCDELVLPKDQVRIQDECFPVGDVFGVDVYEATHIKTNQQVYVTASELIR